MIAVLVLFVVSAVVGLVVLLRVRSGSAADPADVRLEPAVAREMVQEHPALARLLRRRVDPTVASGLALTAAAAVAVGGALGVGLVLEMVQRRAGLARLDDSAARFGVKHLTAAENRSSAAATYAALVLVVGRGRSRRTKAALASFAAVAAVGVAASRVLLGVHWLTDVIAGLALGWGWFAVSSILFGGRLLAFGRPVEQLQHEAKEPVESERVARP